MGCSKNYIMYWGGFYNDYYSIGGRISVHKLYKNGYIFLLEIDKGLSAF